MFKKYPVSVENPVVTGTGAEVAKKSKNIMIKVGTKVVCVYGFEPFRQLGYVEKFPVQGEIYTVRGIKYATAGLLLEEIVNEPRLFSDGFHEVTFGIKHFREIDYSFGEMITEQIEFDAEIMAKVKMFPQPI